jgi:hypothetical protein
MDGNGKSTISPQLLATGARDTRKLPVKLTEAEVNATAREVVLLQDQIAQAESRTETLKENVKAQVKTAEGEVAALRLRSRTRAQVAASGEETRDVEVLVVIDRTNRRRLVVRTDTQVIVEDRPATTEEMEAGCTWGKDYTKGVARLVFEPTKEIVRTRVLTDEERQLGLDAVAKRELVWISAGWWVNADEDEREDLSMPLPHGTRLVWQESGDFYVAHVPEGATLEGLYGRLAAHELPFKVGNDAPVKFADLARKAETKAPEVTHEREKVTQIAAGAKKKTKAS